jgi:hypothetical protein
MKGKKGGKYAAELAKIKEMKALDTILKKGDIENAMLTNSSKESEPVSDNVIDAILSASDKGKLGEHDLGVIEKLTTKKEARGSRKAKKAARPKKASHAPKHKQAKSKKHRR